MTFFVQIFNLGLNLIPIMKVYEITLQRLN
jgi:hypothetical protein